MNTKRVLELKVGVFVVISFLMIMFSMLIVDPTSLREKKTNSFYTLLPDAAGIKEQTQVSTAGIVIGAVSQVSLTEKMVKVSMKIAADVVLPIDTVINVASRGILGDVYIDIARGRNLERSIKPESLIPRNTVSNDYKSLLNTLSSISRDIKQITSTLRMVLGSEETGTSIKDIITNLKDLTVKINDGLAANKQPISEMISNFSSITKSAQNILVNNESRIEAFMADMQATGGLLKRLSKTFESESGPLLKHLNKTLSDVASPENVNAVSSFISKIKNTADEIDRLIASVNQGRGTFGQLLNEDKTVSLINETLEDIQKFIKPMSDVEIIVDYKGEFGNQGSRNDLGLRLSTSPDKSYIVGVIDLSQPKSKTVTTVTQIDDKISTTSETVSDTSDNLRFNFQFAKKWWNTALRFGLFESSGGFAVDQYFYKSSIKVSLEAYNFSRQNQGPITRLSGQYDFWDHLYLTAGLHDLTASFSKTKSNTDDLFYFAGFGFKFTDENIKTLLSIGSLAK